MINNKSKIKSNIGLSLVASLTLGLTPFFPEPHIVGKIRWVMGGAEGMQLMDYMDLLMHAIPWMALLFFTSQYLILLFKTNNNEHTRYTKTR